MSTPLHRDSYSRRRLAGGSCQLRLAGPSTGRATTGWATTTLYTLADLIWDRERSRPRGHTSILLGVLAAVVLSVAADSFMRSDWMGMAGLHVPSVTLPISQEAK